MKRAVIVFILSLTGCLNALTGQTGNYPNPHILVRPEEKQLVLDKIRSQKWAGASYKEVLDGVTPFVDRHLNNPEWILSRYQMNRVPGKRYTRAISDKSGGKLIAWEGDAPFPTVRVSPHMRQPVTPTGGSYRRPSVEELIPNDTSRLMKLLNMETGKYEMIDPQSFVGDINGEINSLALDAAIVYWLTGTEKYAKFAADILNQWASGAYYQVPIEGPCRTGFLDVQTLGDAAHRSLILAYDFVKPYMKGKRYELKYYDVVFEKIASTLAFRGFWNNNWYAAESSTMVFASLSLEEKSKRDFYLSFFLSRDTVSGGCGQLALPSTVEKWLTHDGHWKEPGGYHNFPVGNLLLSALALEKNGYDIFRKFPALFRASYAMLKYSFPDLTVGAFGDTGRASQSAESLEIGIIAAIMYNQPELPEMLSSMKKLVEGGKYDRSNSGITGLLCYIPEIPSSESTYRWPRSGSLEFAKFFLQRNGMDPVYGLMYGVQGASYNHNHNNGMAMELYGMGEVLGVDAGTGPTYEHPYHVNYYSQWAAHNTVAAAGASTSVPFSGSAGRKDIGQIELAAMEPMPDKPAVSPFCSFTDTRYFEKSTGTNQARTLALVRTSDKTGYYVDIYRSDNKVRNDYVYHNIGDTAIIMDENRVPLQATITTGYPTIGKDYPGFRFFSSVGKLENHKSNAIILFPVRNRQNEEIFMQVLLPGAEGRTYFTAKSLKTKTSGRQYQGKKLPLFTMQDNGESVRQPFIAIFEPFGGGAGYSVSSIKTLVTANPEKATALNVVHRDGSRQVIFQSTDPLLPLSGDGWRFTGSFGVASYQGGEISYLYLGNGSGIFTGGFGLAVRATSGAASALIKGQTILLTCNQTTEVFVPFRSVNRVVLTSPEGRKTTLRLLSRENGFSVVVPATNGGDLVFSNSGDNVTVLDWEDLRTAADVCRAYPERVKLLFESLNLDYPGLGKVKAAYRKNDIVKASGLLLEYYSRGKSGAHLRKEIPASSSDNDSDADSVVKNIYSFYNQPFQVPRDIYGHLDWTCKGPTDDIEWAWALNRHYHIGTLLGTYFRTGNRIYSSTVDKDIRDWITSSLPYPGVKSSTEMWRGLEVSFRAKAWSNVFYGLIKSPDLLPSTRLLILTSLPEHAHYGRNFHGQNNWLTMELSALATIATSWPEFRDSPAWLEYSMKEMTRSLREQVYPDGAQTELTSSYHLVALNNFNLFLDICNQAGVKVSDDFRKELEKMWNYTAYTNKPDGFGLLNNDADLLNNRERIKRAAVQFGREDWLYIATNGKEGKKPEGQPSVMFPWAGHLIMRSGYDISAHYAWFDAGPWGSGHQHNDKLHLSVSAFGKDFLVDGGRFAYRGDVATTFRRYATGSHSHNVIFPDGKLQSAGPLLAKEPLDSSGYAITADYDYGSGSFENYTDLSGTFKHTRSVLYLRNGYWIVADRLKTDRPRDLEIMWHWHPACEVTLKGSTIEARNGNERVLLLPASGQEISQEVVEGRLAPSPQGWYSREYNVYEPSPAVIQKSAIQGDKTFVWLIVPFQGEGRRVETSVLNEDEATITIEVRMEGEMPVRITMPFEDASRLSVVR